MNVLSPSKTERNSDLFHTILQELPQLKIVKLYMDMRKIFFDYFAVYFRNTVMHTYNCVFNRGFKIRLSNGNGVFQVT
jgi:hypothetical protein